MAEFFRVTCLSFHITIMCTNDGRAPCLLLIISEDFSKYMDYSNTILLQIISQESIITIERFFFSFLKK